MAWLPAPANTVLVASIESVSVPLPESPSVSVLEKVSCETLVSSIDSQLTKRCTMAAIVLSMIRRSKIEAAIDRDALQITGRQIAQRRDVRTAVGARDRAAWGERTWLAIGNSLSCADQQGDAQCGQP